MAEDAGGCTYSSGVDCFYKNHNGGLGFLAFLKLQMAWELPTAPGPSPAPAPVVAVPAGCAGGACSSGDSDGGGFWGSVVSALDTTLDVGRAAANTPRTVPASVYAVAVGGDCGLTSNLGVECTDVPSWAIPDTAITFGDAVLTDRSDLPPELAAHENSHRWQHAVLPLPVFELAYSEFWVVSYPLDKLRGCKIGSHNPFEILSAGDGGYGC